MQQKHDRLALPQQNSAPEAAETSCPHASTPPPFSFSLLDDERTHQLQQDILKQGGFAFVHAVREVRAGHAAAAEVAYDMAWEQLHSGPWHAVPNAWRDAFALSCMVLSSTLTLPAQKREALRYLDLGLLMGASLFQKDIGDAISFIQSAGKPEMRDYSAAAAEEVGVSVKSKHENSDLILNESWCESGDFGAAVSEGKRRSVSVAECEGSAEGNQEQSACSIRGHIRRRFNATVSEPATTAAPSQISELPALSITTSGKVRYLQSAGKSEMRDYDAAEEVGVSVKSKHENSDLILDESWCESGDFGAAVSEGKRRSVSVAECEVSAEGNQEQSTCSIRGHIRRRFNATVTEPATTAAACQISELPALSITTSEKNSHLILERSLQCDAIERKLKPTLEDFLCCNLLPGIPVIITGAMSHWPALKKWKSMDYLLEIAGDRTVPVEVGRHYLMDEWRQDLVPFSKLLKHIFEPRCPSTACIYLAQHPLFEQISKLKEDIVIPDYCAIGGDSVHAINAWFGPAGTVTPLHYDPDCNLFAQVVGKKYVRLYPASVSESLYPYNESMLKNSSQVDLDNPNYENYPMAKNLPFMDCILEEGEMLYIPPKWWHYVRSLSPSFSTSFWWRNTDLSR